MAGSYTFHNGVDISAATGTAVYPVVSGRARIGYGDEVIVDSPDGRTFQYFHIKPAVRAGQQVRAYRTVLGHVLPRFLHVHLTEIDGFRVHNPVDPGHLTPYDDNTVPTVMSVSFSDESGRSLDSQHLSAAIRISADAFDQPSVPVPEPWTDYPVSPALVSWRLTTLSSAVVVPERTVADFRHQEPANRLFWDVYAAGTYQNFPVFGRTYFFGRRGRYLFNLTPAGLDTRRVRNGDYLLTVDVVDECGNWGSYSQRIRIQNA